MKNFILFFFLIIFPSAIFAQYNGGAGRGDISLILLPPCFNPSNGGTISEDQTICSGATPASLSEVSAPTGNTGTIEFKWQKSITNSTSGFTDILGASSANYSPNSIIQTTWYKRIARVACMPDWAGAAESNVITVTVTPASVGGSVSGGYSICTGGTSGLLSLSGQTGIVLKWQSSVSPFSTWTDISNTATTYISGVLFQTTQFRAVVQRGSCSIANSAATTVTVSPNSIGGAISGSAQVCSGSSSGILTLSGNVGSVVKWQSSVSPFSTWSDISNTLTTYTSGALMQPTQFRAVVQSGNCAQEYSTPFTVSISPTSVGGTVSGGTTICPGSTSDLLTLSGNVGTVIKWQRSISPFSTWTDISNTSTTYTSGALSQTTQFRAVVQSGNCAQANSVSTTVTVSPATVGGTVSGGTAVCSGSTSGILTLSGNVGSVIKWQSSVSPFSTWTDISNTSTTYTSGTLTQTTQFRTVVQSGICAQANSVSTTVTISPTTVGGTVSGGTTICSGSTSGILTLSGNLGSVIKWQSSLSPFSTWTDISNTSTTYTSGILTQTTQFRAVVQSGNCAQENSISTTVTVSPTTLGGAVSGGTAICAGSTSGILTLSGNVGSVIKWQSSVSPFSTWTDISNTSTTYTSGILTQTTQFRAVVQSGSCAQANSASTSVTISPTTVGGSVSGGTAICSGSTSGILTLSGNVGSVIKWQSSVSPFSSWTDISNTSTTYTSGILTQTTQFRAVVQSGNCALANAASTTVIVSPTTVGGTVSGGTAICSGSTSGILTLSGNVGSVIKWQSSVSPFSTWTDISHASTTYTSGALTQTTQFRAVVRSGNCTQANSVSTTVTISPTTVGGTVSGGTTICSGSTSGTLTLSGNVGSVIKWQSSVSPFSTWTDISNTSTTYTSGVLTQTTQFRAVVQSGNCAQENAVFTTVSITPASQGGLLGGGVSQVYLGESIGVLSLTNQIGTVLKWQKRLGSNAWIDIENTNLSYSEIPNIVGFWEYRVVVQNGICDIVNSTSVIVEVLPSNAGAVTGGNSPICLGTQTGIMTLGGYTGSVVKWQKRVNAGSWIDINNTLTSYQESPTSVGHWEYRAVVNNATDLFSAPTVIVVNGLTVGGTVSGGTSICSGSTSGILTLSGNVGSVIKWQSSVSPFSTWTDISNTSITYTSGVLTQTTQFRAVVQSGTCAQANSLETIITVSPSTIAGSVMGGTPICTGNTSGILTLSGNVGSVIKWQSSVSPFSTWTDISNTSTSYTSGPLTQTTQFRAVVQSGNCALENATSSVVTVNELSQGGSLSAPSSQINFGQPTGTIVLTGNVGSVLKWQKRLGSNTWTDIVSLDSSYSEIPSSVGQWEYRTLIQNGSCDIVNSTSVIIEVLASNTGAVSGGVSPICEGISTGSMTVSGFSGTIIKWQKRLNAGAWIDIANSTSVYSEIPSTSGTWEYRVMVNNGSDQYSLSQTIIVSPLSDGGVVNGGAAICIGSSCGILNLVNQVGSVVKWQKSITPFASWTDIANTAIAYQPDQLIQTTQYRAVVQSGTCNVDYSEPAIVQVDQMPNASFTYQSSGLNVSFVNQSNNATSYSWLFGSGSSSSTEINPIFSYPFSGSYMVILNAFNGQCTATYSQSISVIDDGVAENSTQSISVFPIPSSGMVHIQFGSQIANNAQLSVMDITGKIVYNSRIDIKDVNQSINLDLTSLLPGVYNIRINNSSLFINKVIIIEK